MLLLQNVGASMRPADVSPNEALVDWVLVRGFI